MMGRQMKRDANALARALLFPSDKTLQEGRIDASQAVGLDKVVSPIAQSKLLRTRVLHRRAITRYQDGFRMKMSFVVSQRLSLSSNAR